jgi:hypothetical protein
MTIPTDSQRDAACCHGDVITLSTAVMGFSAIFSRNRHPSRRRASRASCLTTGKRAVFINLKPRFGFA